MLHRFATYEQAALFVAMKRDEGYYAEILHEHVSALWGPLAMGGVATWVSELAVEAENEVPDAEPRPSWLPMEISLVAGYAVLTILGVLLVTGMLALLRYLAKYTLPAITGLATLALALAIFAAVISAVGWVCSLWVHQIWNEQHRLHHAASGLHIMLAVILILCSTIFGELLLYCMFQMFAY